MNWISSGENVCRRQSGNDIRTSSLEPQLTLRKSYQKSGYFFFSPHFFFIIDVIFVKSLKINFGSTEKP